MGGSSVLLIATDFTGIRKTMNIITGKAKVAAVLGWPVEHSRSPLLHNFWLKRYGIDGVYIPLAVKPENFKKVIIGLSASGFKGCNITIPNKEIAFSCCDEVDEIARKIGSVNTLTFKNDGKIFGTSTDGAGFIESLRDHNIRIKNCNVLILGAGGAARSVISSLAHEKAKITIANRTNSRALQLAQDLGTGNVIAWDAWTSLLGQYDLLVNTTSLGMEGKESFDFDLSKAKSDLVVTDIVYVPRLTPLLKVAKEFNLKTIEGLGMLLHQARFGFREWFGVDPKVDSETMEYVAKTIRE